ncbi:rhomboid family intramembrane serine protease [Flavitalea sp. BT771]|uniref:rhomboid family intramembrane serine protease n=1 Tax=Flavitalea sp. BT771 TaxID=3063329 RepID=UPI0026E22F26|nr:rhomboid family intramembrane serine protease [Flavitalea sp. BT771]MDO6430034.1 rhomboid family intramembrane serine protease [Flavitalea sp. BT771]MDV6219827.1 rhomboid family intramembrane serine protease [Flavitalea sp. BT771]
MVLPIGDDNRDRKTTPVVNYLLIALNIFAFIYWQKWGHAEGVTFSYAAVPGEILTGHDIVTDAKTLVDPYTGQRFALPGLGITPIPVFLTLFTSMFMHGGLSHLAGNMLFLFLFGDNVEDAMGHVKYLIFYLLCGVLAGLSHVFSTLFLGQNLLIPSLGASGAISAVMAAYMRLFPGKKVYLWIFLFIVSVPAFVAVGLWFALQVINGLGMLGGEEVGEVAYAAHIGGFIFGLLLTGRFAKGYLSRRKGSRGR